MLGPVLLAGGGFAYLVRGKLSAAQDNCVNSCHTAAFIETKLGKYILGGSWGNTKKHELFHWRTSLKAPIPSAFSVQNQLLYTNLPPTTGRKYGDGSLLSRVYSFFGGHRLEI